MKQGGSTLKILRYGLLAALLIPFVLLSDLAVAKEAGKIWAFMFLVEALLPFYIWLVVRDRSFLPKRNAIAIAVTAYLAVMLFTAFFGTDFAGSFWSKPSRLTGVFFFLHVFAFFLMVSAAWKEYAKNVIRLSVCVATVLAIYAFLQTFGAGIDRPAATFGNASFLAQYLVPHIFLAGWLAYNNWTSKRKWAWLAVAGLLLLGLLATKTRAGIAGLLFGAVAVAGLLVFSERKKLKRTGLGILLSIGLLFIGYAAADQWKPTHEWLYHQRLSQQYFSETLGPRTKAASAVLDGIQEKPLFGWGPEHIEQAFYRHYDPTLLRDGVDETRWDRSHSVVLDMLASGGIIGIIAYLGLFFAVVWHLRGRLREKGVETALLVSPVFALLGNNLFLFETVMSSILLFALLGLFSAHERKEEGKPLPYGTLAVALAVLISVAAFWHGVLQPMKASARTHAFLKSMSAPPPADRLMEMADGILDIGGAYAPQYARLAGPILSLPTGMFLTPEYGNVAERLGLAVMNEAKKKGYNYELYLGAVKTLISVPDRSGETDAEIEEALVAMEELSPRRQETAWFEGRFLMQQGRDAQARDAFLRAIDDDPEAASSHAEYAAFLSAYDLEQ